MIQSLRSMPWYQRSAPAVAMVVDMCPLPRPAGMGCRLVLWLYRQCSPVLRRTVDGAREMRLFVLRITGPFAMKTADRFEFMRLFVRIAETGSLSAAAQSLGVSQPTASRQLKQLESLLGVQLVRRSTHDLGLTDAGKRFFEDSRAMLADWEASIDTLRN